MTPIEAKKAAFAAIEEVYERAAPPVLADALGISVQAVYMWGAVPAQHVRLVSRLSGIAREQLRPDIYA